MKSKKANVFQCFYFCFFLLTGKPRNYGRVLNSIKKNEVDLVPGHSHKGGFKIWISGRTKTPETGRNGHFSH